VSVTLAFFVGLASGVVLTVLALLVGWYFLAIAVAQRVEPDEAPGW
jgi:hypothetical protein